MLPKAATARSSTPQAASTSTKAIVELLHVLQVGDPDRPYAKAERLAEAGICALSKRIEDYEDLAEIMASVEEDDSFMLDDVDEWP